MITFATSKATLKYMMEEKKFYTKYFKETMKHVYTTSVC